MPTREQLISRGRALWARTGSDNENESSTAKRLLDAFLSKHGLTVLDLGERPYKDAVAAPPGLRRYRPGIRVDTATYTTQYDDSVRQQDVFFRQMMQRFGVNFTAGGHGQFHVHVENIGFGTTVPTLIHSKFHDRVTSTGADYVLHKFTLWKDLYACVGRDQDAHHTFVGMLGDKWENMLKEHKNTPRPLDLIEEISRKLKDTTYKIRPNPYPSLTELAGEQEWEWVEIDRDTLMALGVMTPAAVTTLAWGVTDAARQYEQSKGVYAS